MFSITRVNNASLNHEVGAIPVYFTQKGVPMYIDPNTGGILFQALAGLLAVLSGVLLVFSKNIRQWISRIRRSARKDEEENE